MKNKIQQLWSDTIENVFQIDKDIYKNDTLKKEVELNEPTFINKINNFNSEWEVLNNSSGDAYKEWNISLGAIPKEIIPFIRFEILYKSIHEKVQTNPLTSHIFQIEEHPETGEIVNVNLIVAFRVGYSGATEPEVYAKLLVYVFNPR